MSFKATANKALLMLGGNTKHTDAMLEIEEQAADFQDWFASSLLDVTRGNVYPAKAFNMSCAKYTRRILIYLENNGYIRK